MIVLAGTVGAGALYHGYKKHHRRSAPAMLFGAGFACLILKEVFHTYHVWLLVPAVALILWAHYLNLKHSTHRAEACGHGADSAIEEPALAATEATKAA